MACYSLDFRLITTNQTLINDAVALMPNSGDVKVLPELYEIGATQINEDGFYERHVMIRYKTEADRDARYTQLTTAAVTTGFKKGSYLQKHTCYHDEKSPKPCVVTDKYEFGG